MLTKQNKDVDREILLRIKSDRSLLSACSSDTYSRELCNDSFFYNRTKFKYPGALDYKPKDFTWKRYYLYLVYYKDKLKNEYSFRYQKGNPKIYYEYLANATSTEGLIERATLANMDDLVEFILRTYDIFDLNFDAALSFAVRNDNKKLVELFLSKGIQNYDLALLEAAATNNKYYIDLFLEKGDVNYGLVGASRGGNIPLIEYFIAKGANDLQGGLSNSLNKETAEYFVKLMKKNNVDIHYNRALLNEASRGNLQMVKYFSTLLNFDISVLNEALVRAITGKDRNKIINYLISIGANDWRSALTMAIITDNQQLINFFKRKIKE